MVNQWLSKTSTTSGLAAAILSIGVALLIAAASPVALVVGYETVGYRYQAALLDREGD